MDGRLQLLDAVHGDAICFGQPRQAVQSLLVVEGRVDGGLELIAGLLSTLAEILLSRANFIEHRRDEAIADLARFPEAPDLRRQRAPQRRERRHAHDGRDHQSRKQPREAENDPPADRVERHCPGSVVSWPSRTVPITTDLAGTSPRASNAIAPVTPSKAGRSPPIRARRSRMWRRSGPASPRTLANNCTMSYAEAPPGSGRSPRQARA